MANSVYQFNKCRRLFMEHLKRHHYSLETVNGYDKDLECFKRFMVKDDCSGEVFLKDIQREDLIKFMDDGRMKGNKPTTVARRLSTLKSFYKFLVYELDFPVDVAARIRIPKVYVPLKNILTEDEVECLLQSALTLGPCYHLLFNALYYTGSRLTPIRTLERKHVYLEEEMIYFPYVKGGKDQYLPLHPRLKALFETYFSNDLKASDHYVFPSKKVPNQPLSASDIRNKLRVAAERAGVSSSITPHTLRHCTATHLTIKNVPQYKIASILGHTDLRSTMRYQHLSVDHLRNSLDTLW